MNLLRYATSEYSHSVNMFLNHSFRLRRFTENISQEDLTGFVYFESNFTILACFRSLYYSNVFLSAVESQRTLNLMKNNKLL